MSEDLEILNDVEREEHDDLQFLDDVELTVQEECYLLDLPVVGDVD